MNNRRVVQKIELLKQIINKSLKPTTVEMISKKQWCIIVIIALIGVMTLPRAIINYGLDSDAVTVAQAAEAFLSTGVYRTSRLPGYPLFEYILTLIIPWAGHIGANLFVLGTYILSVVGFARLVSERKERFLLTILFALTPILLVNAVTTLDYIPGSALIIWCYLCAEKNRHALASILLGLSIACRLTNVLFIIPIFVFLLLRQVTVFKAILLSLLSILLGFIFYVPIFLHVGFRMFHVPHPVHRPLTYILATGYNGLMLFGPIAGFFILMIFVVKSNTILKSFKKLIQLKSATFAVEITTIVLYVAFFLRLSDETAYLIPIVPFFYLIISRWLSKKELVLVGALIVVYAVFTVEFKGGEMAMRHLTCRPRWGIVVRDFIYRREWELLRSRISKFERLNKTVVLTGMGQQFTYKNDALVPVDYMDISQALDPKGIRGSSDIYKLAGRNIYFVYSLSKQNVTLLQKKGYDLCVFAGPGAAFTLTEFGYNPYNLGIERVEVLNNRAFYK